MYSKGGKSGQKCAYSVVKNNSGALFAKLKKVAGRIH